MSMLRYNDGKPRLGLVPYSFWALDLSPKLLTDVAQVLTFGAEKYTPNNWRKGGSWTAVCDSALRHILLGVMRGEENDPESGLPHLAHVGCNLAFLWEFHRSGTPTDDRPVMGELVESSQALAAPSVYMLADHIMCYANGGPSATLHTAINTLSDLYDPR